MRLVTGIIFGLLSCQVVLADTTQKPMICDDIRLIGEETPSPSDKMESLCGIDDPVKVTEVAGVSLSQTLFVDCQAAFALADLVEETIVPEAIAYFKEAPVTIGLGTGYQCRKRRDGVGKKISQHALGMAVDIMSFEFAKKGVLTVEDGWRDRRRKDYKFLRKITDAGCGTFTTSLSPDTNAQHTDHMHFDMKKRKSPWCE